MQYKTKINVNLPTQMVGELHRYKLQGTRSRFIEKAIRNRIDELDNGVKLSDLSTEGIMFFLRQNRRKECLEILQRWFE